MTTPGPPQIRIRPRATNQQLEFWWQAPVSDGGDPITNYVLTDGTFSNDVAATSFYFKQTGLTNKTTYTFTLQASNSYGLGTAATFRSVQPGFLPPKPQFLSLYRQSETSVQLTWTNIPADGDTPDPWRNVVVAPVADSNGAIPYPGDNSVTSNAYRLYGTKCNVNISVATDVSCNYIVRGQNDPGYSLPPYNGTGVFSLKDTPYTDDVIYTQITRVNGLGYGFNTGANFCVQKRTTTPVINTGYLSSEFQRSGDSINQRGLIIQESNATPNYQFTFLNKNGFKTFTTPLMESAFIATYTNPVVPIVPVYELGGATSNLTTYAYDYTDNSFASTILTKSGSLLSGAEILNGFDTNAYFSVADTNASPLTYDHYTIPSGSKIPVKRYTSASYYRYINRMNKELFAFMKEPTDTTWAYILYVPNSGSHVLYDISGEAITTITDINTDIRVLSPGKLFVYAQSNAYTFTLTGTPSTQVRQMSGSSYASLGTSNIYFADYYNGFTSLAASLVDISGDGLRYAISPVASEPALVYTGSSQTSPNIIATSAFTGEVYYDDASDYYFTGVARADGKPGTKALTYSSSGTAINTANSTYATARDYPFYSLLFFEPASTPGYIIVRLKYDINTQLFDVSGTDISGSTLVSSSDNSGINFFSVTGDASRSYKVGPNLFPPVEVDYMTGWFSTYPSGGFTLGTNNSQYQVYNNGNLVVDSNLPFNISGVRKGPDCWYVYNLNGGASLDVARIATNGTYITKTFNFTNDNNTFTGTTMPNGAAFNVQNQDLGGRIVTIDYDTTRNTFELNVFDASIASIGTTYIPRVLEFF